MKPWLMYLLQLLIASGILYGYYHFFLRNKKFHQYNRFYLLAAFVISISVPFLNIPIYFTSTSSESSFILHTLTSISTSDRGETVNLIGYTAPVKTHWLTWQNFSYILYFVIAAIVLTRILFSLKKIRNIIRNNPVEKLNNIRFVNTDEPGTPFSFFRWLFWNSQIELRSEKGEQIFRHELFHIQQKHSRDIIFMEMIMVIFWINPFFHLIKREVKAIHEFLADKFAVKENQHWEYAELLLMEVLGTRQHLVNPFFHNQIKRRIAMITSSKKPGFIYLRKLMVLPIALLVFILFACRYQNKAASQIGSNEVDMIRVADTAMLDKGPFMDDKAYINKEIINNAINRIIREGDSKDKSAKVNFLLNRIFPKNEIVHDTSELNSKVAGVRNLKDTTSPLIVVDDVIIRDLTIYKLGRLDAGNIESINVLKGKTAIDKYSEDGKYGVIEIKTKENGQKSKPTNINASDLYNKIFEKVEIEPSFPGGSERWKQYLLRNLNYNLAAEKGASVGDYTVIVQFVVDKEGNVQNVRALTDHGYGMEREAIRVISKGPSWIPAIQNGKYVAAYRKQPITFSVKKGNDGKMKSEITTKYDQNVSINKVENSSKQVNIDDDNRVFDFNKVEIMPSFPGGNEKWKQFLLRNLNYNLPAEKGAAVGNYAVIVQFIVDKEGNVQDVRALTHHGYGMEHEAVRVISKGPNWIPAMQNGHKVNAYRKQPIVFTVTDRVSSNKEITFRQLPEIVVTGYGKENTNEISQSSANIPILPPIEAGSIEWKRFFERNLNPNLAIKEYWEPGTYKLYIKFSTDQQGIISDAEILNYSNSETAKHCLDLIKHIPKLIPENGYAKTSKLIYFQPLAFIIEKNDNSLSKITKKDFQMSSVNKLLELNEETEILSYSFAIYLPNGVIETKNTGSLLSNACQILVNRAEPGTIFSLNFPRIIKDGKEMSASSKIYRLTD